MITSDWEESFILNLYYKRKGEALDRGNHLGLKLTDQVMKRLEMGTRLLHPLDGEHLQRCSSVLCLLEVLMPSKLFASSRRSTLKIANYPTLPLSTLRKPLIMCQGRSHGGPWGDLVSRIGLCVSSGVSPSSRHGRLAWKVKGSMSTWKRPSS